MRGDRQAVADAWGVCVCVCVWMYGCSACGERGRRQRTCDRQTEAGGKCEAVAFVQVEVQMQGVRRCVVRVAWREQASGDRGRTRDGGS